MQSRGGSLPCSPPELRQSVEALKPCFSSGRWRLLQCCRSGIFQVSDSKLLKQKLWHGESLCMGCVGETRNCHHYGFYMKVTQVCVRILWEYCFLTEKKNLQCCATQVHPEGILHCQKFFTTHGRLSLHLEKITATFTCCIQCPATP